MSLDESWDAYRQRLRTYFGLAEPEDWLAPAIEDFLAEGVARVERDALRTGELRYGGPRDWFRSVRWSPAAWVALHGTEGPRHSRLTQRA